MITGALKAAVTGALLELGALTVANGGAQLKLGTLQVASIEYALEL